MMDFWWTLHQKINVKEPKKLSKSENLPNMIDIEQFRFEVCSF